MRLQLFALWLFSSASAASPLQPRDQLTSSAVAVRAEENAVFVSQLGVEAAEQRKRLDAVAFVQVQSWWLLGVDSLVVGVGGIVVDVVVDTSKAAAAITVGAGQLVVAGVTGDGEMAAKAAMNMAKSTSNIVTNTVKNTANTVIDTTKDIGSATLKSVKFVTQIFPWTNLLVNCVTGVVYQLSKGVEGVANAALGKFIIPAKNFLLVAFNTVAGVILGAVRKVLAPFQGLLQAGVTKLTQSLLSLGTKGMELLSKPLALSLDFKVFGVSASSMLLGLKDKIGYVFEQIKAGIDQAKGLINKLAGSFGQKLWDLLSKLTGGFLTKFYNLVSKIADVTKESKESKACSACVVAGNCGQGLSFMMMKKNKQDIANYRKYFMDKGQTEKAEALTNAGPALYVCLGPKKVSRAFITGSTLPLPLDPLGLTSLAVSYESTEQNERVNIDVSVGIPGFPETAKNLFNLFVPLSKGARLPNCATTPVKKEGDDVKALDCGGKEITVVKVGEKYKVTGKASWGESFERTFSWAEYNQLRDRWRTSFTPKNKAYVSGEIESAYKLAPQVDNDSQNTCHQIKMHLERLTNSVESCGETGVCNKRICPLLNEKILRNFLFPICKVAGDCRTAASDDGSETCKTEIAACRKIVPAGITWTAEQRCATNTQG